MDTQFIHLGSAKAACHCTSFVAISNHSDVDVTYGGLNQCYVANHIGGVSKVEYARNELPGVATEHCNASCVFHPSLKPDDFVEAEYAERVFRVRAVMHGFGPGDLEFDYPLFDQSRF